MDAREEDLGHGVGFRNGEVRKGREHVTSTSLVDPADVLTQVGMRVNVDDLAWEPVHEGVASSLFFSSQLKGVCEIGVAVDGVHVTSDLIIRNVVFLSIK